MLYKKNCCAKKFWIPVITIFDFKLLVYTKNLVKILLTRHADIFTLIDKYLVEVWVLLQATCKN